MLNELSQGRQRRPRGNWGSRYSSWTPVTLPALLVLTLAFASSDSIPVLPGEPPLPDLDSYGLGEADPTPELRGGPSCHCIS